MSTLSKRLLIPILAGLALLAPAVSGAKDKPRSDSKTPWIHVEVTEHGQDGAKVKVNLPLTLARTALNMVSNEDISGGHIRIEDNDISVADMRQLWNELKKAGDAEFVTAEEEDGQTVRVYRKGDRVFAEVQGGDEGTAHVEIPVALVDALLSGNGDELDLESALAELERIGPGEIVRVEDGEDLVRIWIE